MNRKKPKKITTPIGTAVWPKLNEPDRKFDKDGVYEVKLRLSGDDADTVKAEVTNALKEHVEELDKKNPRMAPLPFKEVEDDDGNPTGELDFKFKLKATGGHGDDQWTQRPTLFDSSNQPMTEKIGGGSKIQVGAEIVPYFVASIGAGVSLRLKAVKVFELVDGNRGGADQWSFSEGTGFVTEGSATESSSGSAPTDEFDF